ncbi:hypothetical protein J2Y45_005681 [Dyadobacter sp. BE34]|uniref:Uncharacterized protein n=1 Tax=Dyadobacter fermentans TaxID=94254 RepID=A0ABU1R4Z8_9BACT|nr:hypothetical protein [Dyadobacter fermentans]MDR7046212.1 hypothetical protein [Dyadobacter sp. BE242]MDR7200525.1 hypothetical protein [Dyadobacter sp. BE34]MDR7218485.1 hypothetical protein [Dyadobacter sp. BE31]MDR7266416.1 hypothetical protein [Dyadobacter sp. BE32]
MPLKLRFEISAIPYDNQHQADSGQGRAVPTYFDQNSFRFGQNRTSLVK